MTPVSILTEIAKTKPKRQRQNNMALIYLPTLNTISSFSVQISGGLLSLISGNWESVDPQIPLIIYQVIRPISRIDAVANFTAQRLSEAKLKIEEWYTKGLDWSEV